MFIMKNLSSKNKIFIKTLLDEFPLFICSFLLLSPFWISSVKNDITKSITLFWEFDNYVCCDMYITIFVSFVIVLICSTFLKVKRILKLFFYTLLIFLFIVRKFLLWEFDMDYSPTSFSMLLETNGTEIAGFFETFVFSLGGLKYLALTLVTIVIVCIIEYIWNFVNVHRINYLIVDFLIILLSIFGFISMKSYPDLEKWGGQNTVTGIYTSYKSLKDKQIERKQFYSIINYIDSLKNIAVCTDSAINVLFVVGESFNKYHASIYGYPLNTTPNLENELEAKNLIVFDDVISPFNSTTPSLKNLMCLNSVSNREMWYNSVFWLQLFKKSGYNVYVWDNQKSFDSHYSASFYEMYSSSVCRTCYTDVNSKSFKYDMGLVDDFFSHHDITKGKNFVMFHLQGQHFNFNDRVPDNQKVFSSSDIDRNDNYLDDEKKKEISDYDNAIYYNDYVLKNIFDKVRNTNSVVVFIADHGEEIFDYRDKAHRPPMNPEMKTQYLQCRHEIPAFVWCSDVYKMQNQRLYEGLQSSILKSGSSDLFGHLLLRLSNITSKYYNKENDISSSSYKERPRIVFYKSDNMATDSTGFLIYEKIIK